MNVYPSALMNKIKKIIVNLQPVEKKEIIACDFDGTLIRCDSLPLFCCHIAGHRNYYKALMKCIPSLIGWKLGLLKSGAAKEKLFIQLFKGQTEIEFMQKCKSFAEILPKYESELMAKLKDYREKELNQEFIIISASPRLWIEPWALKNGFTKVIGTELETDSNGILTGRIKGTNCRGGEKVARLIENYPDRSAYRLIAYGDSSGDRELLDYADESHLVKFN